MTPSEEYDLTLKVMQLEQEFTAKSSNHTPYASVPSTVLNPKAQVTARPQELRDKVLDRVTVKSDEIMFEGTCARWFTGGLMSLMGLGIGVYLFKPTAFRGLL
jgi:hypothetical protein